MLSDLVNQRFLAITRGIRIRLGKDLQPLVHRINRAVIELVTVPLPLQHNGHHMLAIETDRATALADKLNVVSCGNKGDFLFVRSSSTAGTMPEQFPMATGRFIHFNGFDHAITKISQTPSPVPLINLGLQPLR